MKLSRSVTKSEAPSVLFVPALDDWLDHASAIPSTVQRWLSLGTSEVFEQDAYMGELLLGQPIASAAVNALVDGATCAHETIIQVELVSLQPDLNAVWAKPSEYQPDQATFNALADLCCEFDLSLTRAANGRMYLSVPEVPDVVFSSLWQIQGVSLDQLMPKGPDAKRWVSLISESQILLHQLKMNSAQTGGDSIWPWGMGRAPDPSMLTPRLHAVGADQSDLVGLSRWMGVDVPMPAYPVCPKAGELIQWVSAPHADADENLIKLDAQLKSLIRRLRWGRLKQVELATQSRRWTLSTARVWKSLG